MMHILGELAQGLSKPDTRVESKLEVRAHECGVGYPEGINATIVTPPVTHNGEDTTYPSLSFHWMKETIAFLLTITKVLLPMTQIWLSWGVHIFVLQSFWLVCKKPKEGFIGKYLDLSLMSGSTIVEVGSQGNPSLEGERRPKKQKCIKKWRSQ
jgi:hypothetical protein